MSSLAPSPATPVLYQGALPPGWELVRVKDVGDVRLGRQRAPQHHTGPPAPVSAGCECNLGWS